MKAIKTWVVVANSNLARIFRLEKAKNLIELEALAHPESRLQDRELVGDRPGRGYESNNPSRHAIEPKTSPKKQEFCNFAKDLCHHLENALQKGEFEKLYLAANPAFLGLLRQNLNPAMLSHISGEVDKDLTQLKANEIGDHFVFTY